MAQSILTADGRTTVPADVRAALGIKAGTRLEWHVTPEGDIIVRAKTLSVADLAGTVKATRHVDIKDMSH
jgi:antitoxin PrlF